MIEGTHGTPGMYRRGCRCDACRANNTERSRRQRAGLPSTSSVTKLRADELWARYGHLVP